jgi:4-phytase/acid phosphatase/peptide/nickel transport system substrate-binding protein
LTGWSLKLFPACPFLAEEERMHRVSKQVSRRFFGVMGLYVLLALAILGESERALAAGPKQGGTVTMGVDQEFRGFDPLRAVYLQFGDRSVIMAIEERLFDMDGKGKLVPELALSATPSADGKTWSIKLRQGISFHDGTPFNADAVVEHWQRMLDLQNSFSGAAYIEPIQSVTKIDDYSVLFKLKHPWAAFKAMLSGTQWTGSFIPSPKGVREDTQNHAPVGTGPFIFKEWLSNDRLVVVKNPNYWRKGKPYLDSVVFRPVPDNEARFSGLRSGETDLILTDWGPHLLQAKEDPSLKVYSTDTSGPYTFIINTEKPPLDDARVRRALAHAWNQDLYLNADYRGTIPVAREPFGGTLSCGDCGYREYDPAKARKLLAEYGKPVSLDLMVTNTPRGREAGEIMQRLFKEVGITLKLTPQSEGDLVRQVKRGDYQIAAWRLMDLSDMGPYLNVCLHSKGKFNFSLYRNPTMDELLTTQQLSTDEKAREKALCGVANLINEDVIYLYGGGRRIHVIAKTGIRGIDRFDEGIVRVSDVWVNGAEKTEKKEPAEEAVKKAKKKQKKAN